MQQGPVSRSANRARYRLHFLLPSAYCRLLGPSGWLGPCPMTRLRMPFVVAVTGSLGVNQAAKGKLACFSRIPLLFAPHDALMLIGLS